MSVSARSQRRDAPLAEGRRVVISALTVMFGNWSALRDAEIGSRGAHSRDRITKIVILDKRGTDQLLQPFDP